MAWVVDVHAGGNRCPSATLAGHEKGLLSSAPPKPEKQE